MAMILPLLYVILVAAVAWLLSFLYVNDFSVPHSTLPKFKRALVIFPHADDETNTAGLISRLCRRGTFVTFVVLTRGESGTADAHEDPRLKRIRAQEMRGVSDRLGAGTLIQEDFGDGKLASRRRELKRYMAELLDSDEPDLVVTYDLAGLYGHEDHIVCAEIMTELAKSHPAVQLWYSVWPERLLRAANLPSHMAKDPHFADRRATPNMRVFTGFNMFAKIASVYGHKSQRRSFRRMMPFHLPIWFVYSLQLYEYYEKVS